MKKAIIYIILLLSCLFGTACATTSYIVDSSGDEPDISPTDGKCKTTENECTLRAAIMEANSSIDKALITFDNISQINPASDLPALTGLGTHIDGEGVVVLDGTLCGGNCTKGFYIRDSSYNIIQGMRIKGFSRGIFIYAANGLAIENTIGLLPNDPGDGSEINRINNNTTGVSIQGQDAYNNTVAGNYFRFNTSSAVSIANGAHDNLIGTTSGTGVNQGWNLINDNDGIGVRLSGVTNNHITGNLIGTSLSGNSAKGNVEGIRIENSSYNVIGLAPSGEGNPNLISGNTYDGIIIGASNHNTIAGNIIGTNLNGTAAIPNRVGVDIRNGSSFNTIGTNGDGTTDSTEGNIISGNDSYGIKISDTNTIKNVIAGNFIGTNFDGSAPLGNNKVGIIVSGDLNLIGTNGDGISDPLEANVISGNGTTGIFIASFGNHISGNLIGVDKTGMFAIGNIFNGIKINVNGNNNLIGTDGDGVADAAERNIISGNAVGLFGSQGIKIDGDNNIVSGNYIGTDATGNTALGNLQDGIALTNSASGNLIGTDGDGVADDIEGNLISGNGRTGIWILGGYINTVAGNLIGTNLSGTAAIPNMHALNEAYGAVHLSAGASGNVIGTNSDGSNDAAEGNLISGNANRGIVIRDEMTHFNIVAGNKIGTDITGSSALGNMLGIDISDDSEMNQIGTDGDGNSDIAERNLVSGNGGYGIYVRGPYNQIAGNYIGTDISGTADLGNGTYGISIADTSKENTIGGSIQKANLIAFNGKAGILVKGVNADKTLISHNSIHSNDGSGIDLTTGEALWFSPNDPGDADLGPNDMMNFPVLDSAIVLPALTITGQISDGLPNTNFEIQFFVNDVCDSPGGHGEGKTYIGSTTEITDGSGNVSFITGIASGVSAGQFITATATTDDKTSEFSACVEVTEGQTVSQPLENDPCDQFDQEEMTLTTFGVDQQQLIFIMYVKKPSGYPGYEPSDDPKKWMYTAFLGDIEARKCNFQGFAERLYCDFLIPKGFLKTSQKVEVFVNDCIPPFYINENVSIFIKEPPPPAEEPGCPNDMDEHDCIDAGCTYSHGDACPCSCP